MGVLAALVAGNLSCPLLVEAAVLLAGSPQLSRQPLIHHHTFMQEVVKVGCQHCEQENLQ
jgi:hypothetical protein